MYLLTVDSHLLFQLNVIVFYLNLIIFKYKRHKECVLEIISYEKYISPLKHRADTDWWICGNEHQILVHSCGIQYMETPKRIRFILI